MDNKPVLAANWKLNPTTAGEAAALVQGITAASSSQQRVTVAVFPPFVWLLGVLELLEGTGIELGGQDCFWEKSGPFTGEVSAAMLAGLSGSLLSKVATAAVLVPLGKDQAVLIA